MALNRPLDAEAAAADRRDLHRGDHRAGRVRRGGRDLRGEEEPAPPRRRRPARPARAGALAAHVAGGFLVQARDNAVVDDDGAQGRDAARADEPRARRSASSPSGSPSTSSRTPSSMPASGATVGIGAGQMSRVELDPHRGLEGGRGGEERRPAREPRQGRGRRLGRLLPLRRRPPRRRGSRRDGGDPARRLDARRRGHRAPPTTPASPWSSPATGISGIDPKRAGKSGPPLGR